MRIIAGKYRGMILTRFAGDDVRPTSDRVKESLFQILEPRLFGARVLDLFCGSGALGLECLSRNAESVHFNDCSQESLKLLYKNMSRVRERYTVSCSDFKTCLSHLKGQYDLIFSDPPYRENYLPEIASLVREQDLLKEGGLIVHESDREEELPSGFLLKRCKQYGRTFVYFLEKEL